MEEQNIVQSLQREGMSCRGTRHPAMWPEDFYGAQNRAVSIPTSATLTIPPLLKGSHL